ncbi:MAG: hypothetical protein GXY58_18340 [Planctomycetaceae bacterium]|nr:hypothetical protein [Planctomycetaceae bacterium]
MAISLDDLGSSFRVQAVNQGNPYDATAAAGRFAVRPGVYVLSRSGVVPDLEHSGGLAAAVELAEFVALPESAMHWAVRHDPLPRALVGQELRLAFTVVGDQPPDRATLAVVPPGAEETRRLVLERDRGYQYRGTLPGDWLTAGTLRYALEIHTGNTVRRFPEGSAPDSGRDGWQVEVLPADAPAVIFDAARDAVSLSGSTPCEQRMVAASGPDRTALQLAVRQFGPVPSAVSFRHELDDELDLWRTFLADRTTLRIRARALEPATNRLEIVLLERDGAVWGTEVPLSELWQDVQVPLDSLRYFSHWAGTPANRGGEHDRIRPADLVGVNVCFGAWLYPAHHAAPHTIEIEFIAVD